MGWRAPENWPLEGQSRAAHHGDRNNRGSLSAEQVLGGPTALCAFPPDVWSKEGICVVLRQRSAVGSVQRSSEPSVGAKHYVDASILKGRMFVKLYRGHRLLCEGDSQEYPWEMLCFSPSYSKRWKHFCPFLLGSFTWILIFLPSPCGEPCDAIHGIWSFSNFVHRTVTSCWRSKLSKVGQSWLQRGSLWWPLPTLRQEIAPPKSICQWRIDAWTLLADFTQPGFEQKG